ncbi:MAG: hypothetical protein QGH42_04805 [Kiritimatiellia bacterium]|nr:hypothetical protein [Kiritimatiellia bacterium]MDP6809595.1 hypothetical protein [Kiritimatiellia bacterium]MDP7023554.1 hypothetical protein [Kiritimatiellia bacterium]
MDNLGDRRESFLREILERKIMDLPDNGMSLLQPIHVRDLASMFRLAIEAPESIGQVYNACLEKAVTLNRYLEITAAVLGCEVQIAYAPVDDLLARYADICSAKGLRFLVTHMCYDIRKPREALGYEPHCTTEEAIKETVLWSVKQLGL